MRAREHVDIVVGLHRLQNGAERGQGEAERITGAFDRRTTQSDCQTHQLGRVEEEAGERANLGCAEHRHILAADFRQRTAVEGHAELVLPVDRHLHDHGLDVDLLATPIELLDHALEREEVTQAGYHDERVGGLIGGDGDVAREGRGDRAARSACSRCIAAGGCALLAGTTASAGTAGGLLARLLHILRQRLQGRGEVGRRGVLKEDNMNLPLARNRHVELLCELHDALVGALVRNHDKLVGPLVGDDLRNRNRLRAVTTAGVCCDRCCGLFAGLTPAGRRWGRRRLRALAALRRLEDLQQRALELFRV